MQETLCLFYLYIFFPYPFSHGRSRGASRVSRPILEWVWINSNWEGLPSIELLTWFSFLYMFSAEAAWRTLRRRAFIRHIPAMYSLDPERNVSESCLLTPGEAIASFLVRNSAI